MQSVLAFTFFVSFFVSLIGSMYCSMTSYEVSIGYTRLMTLFLTLFIYSGLLLCIPFQWKITKIPYDTGTLYVDVKTMQTAPIDLRQDKDQSWHFTISFGQTKHTFKYASRDEAQRVIQSLVNVD